MFKKFAAIEDQKERLEVYNLLKFNLSACARLAEGLALAWLIAGLAWFISRETAKLLNPLAGPWLSAGLAVLLMALVPGLLRLPFLVAIGRLQAAFGLDPRSDLMRLKNILKIGMRRGLALWLTSTVLYAFLTKLGLWQWTVLTLGLGAALMAVDAFFPHFLRPEKSRALREGDLPPILLAQFDRWAPKTGLPVKNILISTSFHPDLSWPEITGIGSAARLFIQEKALATFPPREISVLATAGVLGALVKAPLKFMLLRLSSLAVAVPLASILISTVGFSLWGYPLAPNPALVALIWAAAWLALNFYDLATRFTRRSLGVQLATAAALVLKDESALEATLTAMAQKNLEDEEPSPWREIFRRHHSRRTFIKLARYHQHMSKFS